MLLFLKCPLSNWSGKTGTKNVKKLEAFFHPPQGRNSQRYKKGTNKFRIMTYTLQKFLAITDTNLINTRCKFADNSQNYLFAELPLLP